MSRLRDMTAFGSAEDQGCADRRLDCVRIARGAIRWVLAVSLLGLAFSSVMTYREYTLPAATAVCMPSEPSRSLLSLPPSVYGLVLYALLSAIAAAAMWRTRGVVDDEIMDTER